MGAGCSEQGTPGAGGRADVFFNALRKCAVARAMTADDRLREVVAITCRDVGAVETNWCNKRESLDVTTGALCHGPRQSLRLE